MDVHDFFVGRDPFRRGELRTAQAALRGDARGRVSVRLLRFRGHRVRIRAPGKTFKNLDDLPKLVAEFAASGGAAVWDFHVSNKVMSPTILRAHPHPAKEKKG